MSQCKLDQRNDVGGKAASLGELSSQFPVPDGFVVTARAFREYLNTGLNSAPFPNGLKTWPGARANDLIAHMRQLPDTSLPTALRDSIARAYHQIGGGLVAVRSSGVCEDLPETSFAGQYETFLGIHGEESLFEAVRKCWKSLFTKRAIEYYVRSKLESPPVMAVCIQKMVDARSSGVMFTLDPTTGDASKVLIESCWGLGEAAVQGEVSPDLFAVKKSDQSILESRPGRKVVQYKLDHGSFGVLKLAVPTDLQQTQSLTNDEVIELADVGVRIEHYLGVPQDIEWAIEQIDPYTANILILQSRPETVWSSSARRLSHSQEPLKEPLDLLMEALGKGRSLH